jgi:formylglycine-generating enzyme required for sulfatase activity
MMCRHGVSWNSCIRYTVEASVQHLTLEDNMPRLLTILSLLVLIFPFSPNSHAAEMTANNYREPLTGIEFVHIPAGAFDMGDTVHRGYESEGPLHRVTLKAFYMSRNEVTFAAYDLFAKETGRELPDDAGWGRDSRPVINVSWYDAKAFAEWLSKKSKRQFRLPTEAEWEYAARGGTDTAYWWGNQAGKGNANCSGCGSKWDNTSTAPVGSFAANSFGLHDTLGNVYEWVEDQGHDSYQGAPDDGSAWLDDQSTTRVMRSSSYRDEPKDVRTSVRNWAGPERKQIDSGFRLVMEP